MNGKDAPIVALADPSSARLPGGRVFVSYAHEREGERLAGALIEALRARGCDVMSDHESQLRNPSSVPAWMDDEIADRVVLCVLTPEYMRAFAGPVDGAARRKGVRYELRGIRQRIYDHAGRFDCPVIPVATPRFPIELAAPTLRALDISRFDPETGHGADQIVARITALEGIGGNGAMSIQQTPPVSNHRVFRQVIYDLEDDPPPERAIELVRKCLRLAEDPELFTDLALAFPLLAEVITDLGQVDLMRTLAAACLHSLRSHKPQLRSDGAIEAHVLIRGIAWCLQRDHSLQEALNEAQRGIQLAEKYEARRIAALGKQSVGRIHRLLAEDAQGSERDYHLTASSQALIEAKDMFSAIDGPRVRRSEVGSCLGHSARTQLVRYRLLGDRLALTRAAELARQAGELFTPDQKQDALDLMILKAEIAATSRRYVDGRRLLGDVIEALIGVPGVRHSEPLARAYLARAGITLASNKTRADALSDLKKAHEIFLVQKLTHAAATCMWIMMTVDSKSVTKLKMTRSDALQLEALTADPRVRLAAVAELERQVDAGMINHPAGRRTSWTSLVYQVGSHE